MAEKIETINILRVDGTQAVTTLRELKAEIERDKDALVALGVVEEGDVKKKAQQDQITKKLEQDLKLLNQVMAAGKVTTLESAKATDTKTASYYEMQKALTTLKKEWKNLSAAERQEAEGQEILQKIKELDAELKTLDADIGQFQRNVGNYGMTFKEALDQAQMGANGLNQGMMALSSVMMINGQQNEKTKKAMAGMHAMVLLLNSSKGIVGMVENIEKATKASKKMEAVEKATTIATQQETAAVETHTGAMVADEVATEGATAATNAFKVALITTGVGAIVVLLGTLVAELSKLDDEVKKLNGDLSDDMQYWQKIFAAQEEELRYRLQMWKARGKTEEEMLDISIQKIEMFAEDYKRRYDAIEDKTSEVAVAMKEKWEGSFAEITQKLHDAHASLEEFLSAAEKKEAQKGMTALEVEIDNIKAKSVQLEAVAATLFKRGIINATEYAAYLGRIADAEKAAIEAAEEAARAAAGARWRAARDNALRILQNAQDSFKTEEELLKEKYERELAQLKKFGLSTTELTEKYEADLQAIRDRAAEAERKAAEEEEARRQKDEEKRKADEEKAYEERVKLVRSMNKEALDAMDKEVCWAKRRNALVEQSDEERAQTEYQIIQEANQKKLEALRLFAEEAFGLGDQEAALQYQQQAADLSVEIELQAAEEKKRIYDRDRKNREDAAKQTLSSISTTMGALADIFEANTELDEENARKAKNLRIAAATIDMLQGAVTAYSSAQSLGPPLGPIVGGINAAAVIATGLANIAKIKAQKVDANSSTTQTPETPAVVQAPTYTPEVTQVRNLTGSSEEERLNKMASSQKVYILNSDLEAAAGARKVQTQETTF